MKIVFKYQDAHQDVVDFLEPNNYPHLGWTVELFEKLAFIVRLETSSKELVGYGWYTWMPDTYKIMEYHIAVKKEFRGRWVNRTVSQQVCDVATFLDARLLFLFWKDPRPLRKLRHLNWKVEPPFAWIEV